ncbi:hypothetical protein KL928_004578 [Ogataea angusta]|uniref:Protein MTH1 n=1 Tax=Pichia angusta TaxID=870730 RepID=A0AAN6I420_PICAN|nr:uncharacterized protein KL928_004578 [Ogataea angusta]KAG7816536.1 hypothetical protein KL928_004578 [Ogataea angusta]
MTHEFPELRKYDPEPSNASVARTNERTPDPAAVPGQVRRTAGPAQQVPSGGVVSALELRPRETRVRGVSVSGLQETRQGARGAEEGSLELSGDVQRHLQNLQERTSAKRPETVQPATEQEPSLKYGSSPLRRAITVSSQDSSDDASTESEPAQLRRTSTVQTADSSLFSHLTQIYTNTTLPTQVSEPAAVPEGCISLADALPHDFRDYYSPDLQTLRFPNGRPTFTKRGLRDWELNDLRSLLIVDGLRPEWHGKVPQVVSPYPTIPLRIQVLPLDATDAEYVQLLASSDIYKESRFDEDFRRKTANYIVQQARQRHASQFQSSVFLKYEWRNIVENYLLNLAIENQCRYEFKVKISGLKKLKHEGTQREEVLYKKALKNRIELTDEVKFQVWQEVQRSVYKSLGSV